MPPSLIIGDTQLTLVRDGLGALRGEEVLGGAPRDLWGPSLQPGPLGELPVTVSALLVRRGPRIALIDTGFGEERPERQERLLDGLAALGVQPKHVELVVLTHAHGDHALGCTLLRGGRWLPAFPLAQYVMQRAEVEDLQRAGDVIWETRLQPLAERGQLCLVHGRAALELGLTCWPTPGHTRGHQTVLIEADGAPPALYVGDLAVLARNLERPEYGPAWAWSPAEDQRSRREVTEWAVDTGATLILGHDPAHPFVRLARAPEGYLASDVASA